MRSLGVSCLSFLLTELRLSFNRHAECLLPSGGHSEQLQHYTHLQELRSSLSTCIIILHLSTLITFCRSSCLREDTERKLVLKVYYKTQDKTCPLGFYSIGKHDTMTNNLLSAGEASLEPRRTKEETNQHNMDPTEARNWEHKPGGGRRGRGGEGAAGGEGKEEEQQEEEKEQQEEEIFWFSTGGW